MASSVAVGVAVLMAGFALLDFDTEQNSVPPADVAKQQNKQKQPAETPRPTYTYVTMVRNNPDVNDKYVVGNSPTLLDLVIVDDEELLSMLAAHGKPSILGKINGELRLIPSSRPAAN